MILVTGATGLVGSHLIKELSGKGEPVVALYNKTKPSADLETLATWKQVDILDITAIEDTMQDIQQVYHCAAIVSFNPKEKTLLHQFNIQGTANIVNACINANVDKLVHVSSVASLGRIRNGQKVNEAMNWTEETSNSEYGKSKFLSEMEVWRGIGEGLNAVIVNPSIILGAGNWESGSTGIFKTAYDEFPWYTNGSSGFVDVVDVTKAMVMLMNSTVTNERFILSGWNLPYRSVFDAIATSFNKKKPTKQVTPLLAAIVWRIEKLKSIFSGKTPLLTKETAATAQTTIEYDSSKLLKHLPDFVYSNFENAIQRICGELKIKYQLK
ncbi:MAG: NAD-dependent epimerase/dehydratase family protein [Chitinophagaceae bacterium]